MAATKKKRSAKKAAKKAMKKVERKTKQTYGGVSKKAEEIKGGFLTFKVIGDSVAGEVVAVDRDEDGKYGPEVKVSIKCEDGALVTFRAPTILRNAIEQNGVTVGDYMACEFIREVKAVKGKAKQFLFEHQPRQQRVKAKATRKTKGKR